MINRRDVFRGAGLATLGIAFTTAAAACGGDQQSGLQTQGSTSTNGEVSASSAGSTSSQLPASNGTGGLSSEGSSSSAGPSSTGTVEVPSDLEAKEIRLAFQEPAITAVGYEYWRRSLESSGIKVSNVEFESSNQVFRALLTGNVDVASLTMVDLVHYMQEAKDQSYIYVAGSRKTTDYILVCPSEITDLKMLEGKKVGISTPGDLSDTLTRYVLTRADVKVDAVQFPQIGGTSARSAALLSGSISGGALHCTDAYVLEDKAGGKLVSALTYADYVQDYLQAGLVVSKDFAAKHPQLMQFLVDKYMESTRWSIDQPEEFIALAVSWIGHGLTEDIAKKARALFTEKDVLDPNGAMAPELVQHTIDVEQELGDLTGDIPDPKTWVDSSYVDNYLARFGRR